MISVAFVWPTFRVLHLRNMDHRYLLKALVFLQSTEHIFVYTSIAHHLIIKKIYFDDISNRFYREKHLKNNTTLYIHIENRLRMFTKKLGNSVKLEVT